MAQKTHTRQTLVRMLAFLMAIVTIIPWIIMQIPVSVSAAKGEEYPYVAVLREDKNGRNERYDLVVKIPEGAEVIVLGNSKNYPHRLMVAYGNNISHITPNDVEKVSNSYAAVLPEDKNLRDNSYGYVAKILKGSLVIVKGDSKSYSGRKDIKFGEFSGTIGSKGIVAMTEKEASSIIKSGKTTVGGTSTKENGKLELAVNRYKRTFYNERFQEIGVIPANTKVQTSGKTCTKWGIKYLEVTYNGNKGYIRDYYVDQVSEKNKMIIVDISEQCVYAYESGKLYAKSPCVTGTKGKNDTPLGTFSIQYRERKTRMRGADYDVVVEYTLPFYGDYCLHASDRKFFGGSIYTWNGSHGCINLPKEFARELYYWVNYKGSNRTPVYVVR